MALTGRGVVSSLSPLWVAAKRTSRLRRSTSEDDPCETCAIQNFSKRKLSAATYFARRPFAVLMA
jgi:hypothetical protein